MTRALIKLQLVTFIFKFGNFPGTVILRGYWFHYYGPVTLLKVGLRISLFVILHKVESVGVFSILAGC